MRYTRACVHSIAYELPAAVVASRELEERLAPAYRALRVQPGQLEALTGIRERRYWPLGMTIAEGSARAAIKLLDSVNVTRDEIGILIHAGVCRDNLEPATACAVADAIGLRQRALVYDVSNACLGVVNGIMQIANAVELGQTRAGLVVSCESARQIVDLTIDRLNAEPTMERFRLSLATMTGGSGAVAVLVTDRDLSPAGHAILGGVAMADPKHHRLCRWGPDTGIPASAPMQMVTDAAAVLEHGVALGVRTWQAFLELMGWASERVNRTICHQVGGPHRDMVLAAIGVPKEKDFPTYEFLGNIGTVSLPITAAIAEERGMLEPGQRTAFCGIGSGLNCLILGLNW